MMLMFLTSGDSSLARPITDTARGVHQHTRGARSTTVTPNPTSPKANAKVKAQTHRGSLGSKPRHNSRGHRRGQPSGSSYTTESGHALFPEKKRQSMKRRVGLTGIGRLSGSGIKLDPNMVQEILGMVTRRSRSQATQTTRRKCTLTTT